MSFAKRASGVSRTSYSAQRGRSVRSQIAGPGGGLLVVGHPLDAGLRADSHVAGLGLGEVVNDPTPEYVAKVHPDRSPYSR